MLKAEQVQLAHLEVLQGIEAVNKSIQSLLALVPNAPDKDGKPGPKMITPDVFDSAQAMARGLKVCKLDALVVAQTLMGFTEEAREAAIAAKVGQVPDASPAASGPEPEGGRVLQGDFTPKG